MDIYGPYAERYDELSTDFVKTLENDFRKKLLARFVPQGSRVLDLGCGTAATYSLLDSPKAYVGVDISPQMLKVAQEKIPSDNIICYDLSRGLSKLEKQFDSAVSMYGSLSHLTESQLLNLLKDVYQSLRPSGTVVLDLMNKYSLERLMTGRWKISNYRFEYLPNKPEVELEFYTPSRLKALMESTGFKVLLITSATAVPARGLFGLRSLCNRYEILGKSVYGLEVLLKSITDRICPKLGRALIVVAKKP